MGPLGFIPYSYEGVAATIIRHEDLGDARSELVVRCNVKRTTCKSRSSKTGQHLCYGQGIGYQNIETGCYKAADSCSRAPDKAGAASD